jgi:hypothetical protein
MDSWTPVGCCSSWLSKLPEAAARSPASSNRSPPERRTSKRAAETADRDPTSSRFWGGGPPFASCPKRAERRRESSRPGHGFLRPVCDTLCDFDGSSGRAVGILGFWPPSLYWCGARELAWPRPPARGPFRRGSLATGLPIPTCAKLETLGGRKRAPSQLPRRSFDAAEVDQPHLVVKVRFFQHALLQKFQLPWGMEYNRTRTPILNQTIHNARIP